MKRYLGLAMLLAVFTAARAGVWSGNFRFSTGTIDLSTTTRDGRTFVLVNPGAQPTPGLYSVTDAEPGRPLLPAWSLTVVIPQGMRVAGVDAVPISTEQLPGRFDVFPAQEPVPASVRELPPFRPGDAAVYGSDLAYPGVHATAGPVGIKSGFRLVTVTLHPVQYHPVSGRLVLANELQVRLRFEPDPTARPERLTQAQIGTFGDAVRALVYNPKDVARYAPAERQTDWGSIDYVIITNGALSSEFAPLVWWRTKKGYRTEIRTVSWISANYAGRDDQEKIRNFIRDYYNNQGTRWVLLGGDVGVVPARLARAVVGSYTGNIPCDLYYADLQWSWDGNNNNIFGEANVDTVDLYYDLYVGRASVDNATQARTVVRKVLTHERNPPTDYLRRLLLVDSELWAGYNHWQTNESIAGHTPAGWTDRFIDNPGNTTMVRDSLNNGFQFSHMVGHGNQIGIYTPSLRFYGNPVINGHTNQDRVGLINSIACDPGAFDYSDCLAETTHFCTTGGALAVIFNSRYGWGQPPSMGPSERLDIRFYHYFFMHDSLPNGMTHALSKEVYRNSAMSMQVWRWCYYELTLFGDPLQMMYRNVPTRLNAAFTSPITIGNQNFTVTVTSGGSNVNRALVCLWKGTEVYARDYTNALGQITFAINPSTGGYMYVTATKPDYLPDEDSCEVIAGSTDVGPIRIIAPLGTLDSGTVATPGVWVKNFGSLSATFPVAMRIGTGYSDVRTVTNLAPDESVQVWFNNWTAAPRGTHLVRCSTGYSQDQNRANDTLSRSVSVRVVDAAALRIVAPAGAADSGTVITPRAWVRNCGTGVASFNATFTIGAGYTDARAVNNLAAGDSVLVSFNDWTAGPCGAHAVRCSVALAGDMVPANDVASGTATVGIVDVALTRIVAPVGAIDSKQVVVPACTVANNSTTSQAYSVRMRVGTCYDRVVNVAAHPPLSKLFVQFPPFADWPRGTHAVTAFTALPGDQVPANDTARTAITVSVKDVACVRLLEPFGTYDSGTTVTPACSLDNLGSTAVTYSVRMRVGSVYSRAATVTNHAPGTRVYLAFPSWVASPVGNMLVRCSTELAGDCRSANNRQTTLITVRSMGGHDVSCTHIRAPVGQIDSGSPVFPSCSVRNYGGFTETYAVRMRIGSVYEEVVTVVDHAPGTSRAIDFPQWRAWPVGPAVVTCSTELGSDDTPLNNRRSGEFVVLRAGPDVGCTRVTSPVGPYPEGRIVAPACSVFNFGNAAATYALRLTIDTLYDSTVAIADHEPGTVQHVYLPVWVTRPAGSYVVTAYTMLAGDLAPGNDTARSQCVVLPPSVKPWSERTPMPLPSSVRPAGDGAWLAYHAGRDVIYAAKGNKSNDFYQYNPNTDVWLHLTSIPMGTSNKYAGKGACGTTDGAEYVYAAKGNNTSEFWRYSVARDSWAVLAEIPLGPSRKRLKGGGDLVFVPGDTDYVYLLKGYRNEFMRYLVDADSWELLEPAPTEGRPKWDKGSWLAYDQTGTIYAHKAKYHELWAFDLTIGRWDTSRHLTGMPFVSSQGRNKKSKDGGCGTFYDNRLYSLKGGNTQEFWRYSIDGDLWTELETLPVYGSTQRSKKVKNGADIASDGQGLLFALKGNKTVELWCYTVMGGFAGTRPASGPVQVQTRGQAALGSPRLEVLPNPLRAGFATIRLNPRLLESSIPVVSVFDASGRCVRRQALSLGREASGVVLDLRDLPAGVYTLQLTAGSQRATQKLVIQH
ncbi:T9SS type A sorting domain-containing protein [candidate division WOR-3 bacterium]|nr:T9SS type A sorting domain-containing protein [candidate division WOR-3 bacterium]